jgi:predicted transcriptional regulator
MSELQELAISAIRSLPKTADLDDILEEIIHQAKIEEGLRDSREGRTFTIEQVEKHFNQR